MSSFSHPIMVQCRQCRAMVPEVGLGADSRCLDCLLSPILNARPRLTSTQQRKITGGKPTAYRGDRDGTEP